MFQFSISFLKLTLWLILAHKTFAKNALQVFLNDYNQKDSITQCSKDLLVNDTFFLFGNITFQNYDNKTHGELQIKTVKNNSIVESTYFKENKCLTSKGLTCKFENNIIRTTYTSLVGKFHNKAAFCMLATAKELNYTSKNVHLPAVYDESNIILSLNDKALQQDNSTVHIPYVEKEIKVCCLDSPEPCSPVISDISLNQLSMSNHCVAYQLKSNETTILKIGYIACGYENLARYTVRIEFIKESAVGKAHILDNGWLIAAIICLIATNLIALIFVICMRKKRWLWFNPDSGVTTKSVCWIVVMICCGALVALALLVCFYIYRRFTKNQPATNTPADQAELENLNPSLSGNQHDPSNARNQTGVVETVDNSRRLHGPQHDPINAEHQEENEEM